MTVLNPHFKILLTITSCLLVFAAPLISAQVTPEEFTEIKAAAEQGIAESQYNLGVMYGNGLGVPKDDAVAVKWYTKAAEQGLARAQYNLAVKYDNGTGVPEDDAVAVKWYTKAAEQGHASAQTNIGIMYAKGNGVPEDYAMAYMWWNLASAQGYNNAKHNKDIVAKRMTREQIAEAQKLSRECSAKEYKNCGY